jgi:hypothetical protein
MVSASGCSEGELFFDFGGLSQSTARVSYAGSQGHFPDEVCSANQSFAASIVSLLPSLAASGLRLGQSALDIGVGHNLSASASCQGIEYAEVGGFRHKMNMAVAKQYVRTARMIAEDFIRS